MKTYIKPECEFVDVLYEKSLAGKVIAGAETKPMEGQTPGGDTGESDDSEIWGQAAESRQGIWD